MLTNQTAALDRAAVLHFAKTEGVTANGGLKRTELSILHFQLRRCLSSRTFPLVTELAYARLPRCLRKCRKILT
jgi:hypothetical protein